MFSSKDTDEVFWKTIRSLLQSTYLLTYWEWISLPFTKILTGNGYKNPDDRMTRKLINH